MALNFDKYAQEGNAFMNQLANDLGHPEEKGRTGVLLRSVLHTLRDRITISESFDLIAQLPMFLKAVYVENWKYFEKPIRYNSKQEFYREIEVKQIQFGESEYAWNKSTEELTQIIISRLMENYIAQGEAEDIADQLPSELKDIMVKEPQAS